VRRNRFEIEQDALITDRVANLEKLVRDPQTAPAEREKYHRQLAATRGRMTRLKREREERRRKRKIELAQQRSQKLAEAPAPLPSPERLAELPPGVRAIFERNATTPDEPPPVESAPAQSVPDPAEEAARQEAAERDRRLRELSERIWQAERGFLMVYRLADGRLMSDAGIQISPTLRRSPTGQWFSFMGSPVALIEAEDQPTPGLKFFHGFNWTPEQYASIVQQLAAEWTLPPARLTPSEAVPVIASAPGERREMIESILESKRQAERQRLQDPNRFSLGPVSGVGKLGSAGY
jgi:hypothetical protein